MDVMGVADCTLPLSSLETNSNGCCAGGGSSDDNGGDGGDEGPGFRTEGASAQSEQWNQWPPEQLAALIRSQIPRFRNRPYLPDTHALSRALEAGLPVQLRGDFCWSLCFEAPFIQTLAYEGFLPICCELGGGSGLYVLLPKLHVQRCVLLDWTQLHLSRKVFRRCSRYRLTVSRALSKVLAGCIKQHGESWIYPPMRAVFKEMSLLTSRCVRPRLDRSSACAPLLVSFELWEISANGSLDSLVAGEFGAAVGASYTSFSGFRTVDGSGTIQMALTAQLLQQAGFEWWDMGQEHDYKLSMGAELISRASFLHRFRELRSKPNGIAAYLDEQGEPFAAQPPAAPCAPRQQLHGCPQNRS